MIKVPVSKFKSVIYQRAVFFIIHYSHTLDTLTSVRYPSVLSQTNPIDRQTRPSPLCSWCKEVFMSLHIESECAMIPFCPAVL